jgi:predicted nucleotidyltransferase
MSSADGPKFEMKINPIAELAQITGAKWENIETARQRTLGTRAGLRNKLEGLDGEDTSIVVFGSLARGEETAKSDIDWTLLVDGMVDPMHLASSQEIESRIAEVAGREPGREGTFGSLAFSHQIVHWIGGEDDSNANTTRRILLLLESRAIGRDEAWSRVINNVLSRYLKEDHGLWEKGKKRRVPLFLLNDIARYWRIMVVDFAYKQRTRANKGYALRNIKLGLSRKLIYASGLLACFSCQQDFDEDEWQSVSASGNAQVLIEHLRSILGQTPLEILASRLIPHPSLFAPAQRLFDSYDKFLALLANKSSREYLDALPVQNLERDPLFQDARSIRREFGDSLSEIFLSPQSPLYNLTIKYGVF